MITKKKAVVITIVYSLIIALIGGLVGFLATYFPMKKSNNAYVSAQQEYILNNDVAFFTGAYDFNVDITLVSCVQNGITYSLTNNDIHVVKVFSSGTVSFNFKNNNNIYGSTVYINTALDFSGGTHKTNVATAFNNLSTGVITDLHFVITGGADVNNANFLNWLSINTNPAIVQLATPTITGFSMNSHAVYFSAVPNASSYLLKNRNGQTFSATGSGYILTVPGAYQIQAIGDGVSFSNSNWSEFYNCYSRLSPVTNFNFNSSLNSLSWSAVPSANSYKVFRDNVLLGSTSSTNFIVNSLGVYEVQAVNTSNIFFLESSRSSYNLTGVQLATPTISLDNVVLSWETVPNASSYEIFCDNSLIDTVNANYSSNIVYYTLTYGGNYYIRAISSNYYYNASAFSNTINIPTVALDTPFLSNISNMLTWDVIPNAYSYNIYLNDNFLANTTANSFLVLTSGSYTIQAVSKSPFYTNGAFSNSVNISITANDGSFTSLIGAVVDVPLSLFVSLFNFDFLGINLMTFFSTMISLCVVIILIKFVLAK